MKLSQEKMRSTLFLIVIVIGCSQVYAREKLTLGVKGNIGVAKSTEPVFSTKLVLNYNYGLQLNYYVLPFLGVETGLQFYKTGFADEITYTDETGEEYFTEKSLYTYNYVSIPIYARVKLRNLYGVAGINITQNTKSHVSTPQIQPSNALVPNQLFLDDVEKTNYDLHLGIGYQLMLLERFGVFMELGYNHQLKDLLDVQGGSIPKLYNFNIGGGICVSLINK